MIPSTVWCVGRRFPAGVGVVLEALGPWSAYHPLGVSIKRLREDQAQKSAPIGRFLLGPWLSRGLENAPGMERLAGPNFGHRTVLPLSPGCCSEGQAPRRPGLSTLEAACGAAVRKSQAAQNVSE